MTIAVNSSNDKHKYKYLSARSSSLSASSSNLSASSSNLSKQEDSSGQQDPQVLRVSKLKIKRLSSYLERRNTKKRRKKKVACESQNLIEFEVVL